MQRLDDRLEHLLDKFEREVEPYEKLSAIGFIMTPVAVIGIVLLGWLLVPSLYWIVGGVLAALASTKLPILYADRKKHRISNCKYKPLSGGICMCDLSQLRYHMRRLEKSEHEGGRMRHGRWVSYYKQRVGLA